MGLNVNDGAYTIYEVQFFTSNGDRWVAVDIANILFTGMSFEEKRSGKAERFRALIDPQHDCWQRTGVHGYLKIEDAWAAHDACVATGKYDFRVARCSWVKHTDPVTDRGALA